MKNTWASSLELKEIFPILVTPSTTALEATQGQMHGFFSQRPHKCHLEEMASVGD